MSAEALFFTQLPSDLQIDILQSWCGSLAALSSVDVACTNTGARPLFLSCLAELQNWPWSKNCTVRYHGSFFHWLLSRHVTMRSVSMNINALHDDALPMLECVQSLELTYSKYFYFQTQLTSIMQALPNLTSFASPIVTDGLKKALDISSAPLQHLVISHSTSPSIILLDMWELQDMIPARFGQTLHELRSDVISLTRSVFEAITANCKLLRSLEFKWFGLEVTTTCMNHLFRSCPDLAEVIVHNFYGLTAEVRIILQAGHHNLKYLSFKTSSVIPGGEILLTVLEEYPWLERFECQNCSYGRSTAALSLTRISWDASTLARLVAACGAVSKLTIAGSLPDFNLFVSDAQRALEQICSTVTDLALHEATSVCSTINIPSICPLLKRLSMGDSTLCHIAQGCPLLEHLTIDCTNLDHDGRQLHSSGLVEVLTKCPHLKTIRFDSDVPNVDDEILIAVTDKRCKLQKISWKGTIGITPDMLERFRARAKALQLLPVTICVKE